MAIEDRIAPLLEPIQQFFGGLSPRDRLLVGLMALALFGGGAMLAMRAMNAQVRGLERNVRARQQTLEDVQFKALEYQQAMEQVRGLEEELASYNNFSLTAYLEEAASDPTILITREQIRDVKDRGVESGTYFTTRRAEMSLSDVRLDQLVRLLDRISESPQHLRVDTVTMKADFRDRTKLDVNLEVLFFQPAAGGAS